jgi:hypothetical protein
MQWSCDAPSGVCHRFASVCGYVEDRLPRQNAPTTDRDDWHTDQVAVTSDAFGRV